ncbi:threonine-phosphate decarboxylase CobD [Tolumonas osonensis]|uniref:threonine-phosphate decarboxylase n=1 Tax=Tolumonas osonensis TaxID=675874 RepID=A0A841GHA3_9GAMM|nr:threonine-phosphate decarboxylase CobD [Tolumonas osonensis]MBB6054631.1 threonine-phosphate decarboxylase [Tolumonas osonensis]
MAKSGQHGGNVLQMAERYGLAPDSILDFSANINPLGMPASLKQAIVDNLTLAEHYPDIDYQRLHAALARHIGCSPRAVLAGNGATELIFALTHYLRPKKAMLPVPGFAEYRRALERESCDIVNYTLHEADDYQPTAALLDALTPDLDCLFLCTPNNPTGQQPPQALLLQILDRCRELQITLIVDESFIDFLPGQTGLTASLNDYPNLFILRSLTKFFAIPGLRLGYLLSSDMQAIDTMRDQREPWTINAFAALAGETVLDDRGYIQQTHHWLQAEQEYLYQALSQFSELKVWRPAANYIFIRNQQTELNLQDELLRHHLLIRHCANYPGLSDQHYRVAIKSHENNQQLVAALKQVFGHG